MPRLALLAALTLVSGCALFGPDDRLADLDAARARWEAQHLSYYLFEMNRQCYCAADLFPARIYVARDTVQAVLDPQTGEPKRIAPDTSLALRLYPDAYPTLDGLFALIEQAARNGAHRLEVTYDEIRGFPTEIRIDYLENAADDEVTYTVSRFAVPLD